jgi:hypothetical protein
LALIDELLNISQKKRNSGAPPQSEISLDIQLERRSESGTTQIGKLQSSVILLISAPPLAHEQFCYNFNHYLINRIDIQSRKQWVVLDSNIYN